MQIYQVQRAAVQVDKRILREPDMQARLVKEVEVQS